MSISILANTLPLSKRKQIVNDIRVEKKQNEYTKIIEEIIPYRLEGNSILLPMFYSVNILKQKPNKLETYPKMNCKFTGKLRPEQKGIRKEAIAQLNKQHTTVIAAYTGCGKTITSINIACRIKLKVLILISRVILVEQWKQSITKFASGAKIQFITSKTKMKEDTDFFIMNAINVPKRDLSDYKCIGTLIVDEVHLIATKIFSKSLTCITPRFSIALSATPTRSDGMDKLIHLYFGKDVIYRKLNKKHTVFRINTNLQLEYKKNMFGKIDWNSLLESQASSIPRNQMIIDIILKFKDRTFLVLCKRIKQVNYLMNKLVNDHKQDVTFLTGNKRKYNQTSRILIATIQKCGTGFDHPKLDTLLLAADVQEYFIQYLGRVMRRPEVEPYIFDLVDDQNTLRAHYYTRRKVYISHGGTVNNIRNINELNKVN